MFPFKFYLKHLLF